MHHDILVFDEVGDLAVAAAEYVADRARRAVVQRGVCNLAVSGGRTPVAMFRELVRCDVPWESMVIFQVDERIAPLGDSDRNLTMLRETLEGVRAVIESMPVDDPDPDEAARLYAALLPERFDLVHLGLGTDGHTASLVPGDPALEIDDCLVAVTNPYQGRRRLTFTYRALSRADDFLWLVSGVEKRAALSMLLDADHSIPAGRVTGSHSLIMTERAALCS